MIEDAEFIQFLKSISLYVTSDESPREGGSHLYKNLSFLREKFKEFKTQKSS